MTREEAVNELNDRIKVAEYVNSDYIDCVSVDAVKMAISALSVPETNVGDMISRQAAIDFIAAGHLCNPNEPRWSDNEVVNFLKSRPSAQRKGKWYAIGNTGLATCECGYITDRHSVYNFCPKCGLDMRG